MAHDPKDLVLHVEAALQDVAHVPTFKSMFGGILGYVDGKAWVSCSDVGLAVKLDPKEQEVLLAIPGAERLRYEPSQPPSKQYIVVPEPMLTDPTKLGHWLAVAATYVASLPAKKKK